MNERLGMQTDEDKKFTPLLGLHSINLYLNLCLNLF